MNKDALQNAASLISMRNVNSRIAAVRAAWDDAASKLTVQYFVDGVVSDDERELCELTCAELLAEFPEIRLADTECTASALGAGDAAAIVYRRGGSPT